MTFLAIISFFAGLILLTLIISKIKHLNHKEYDHDLISKQIRIPLYIAVFLTAFGIFMMIQLTDSAYKKYYWQLENDLIYEAENFCQQQEKELKSKDNKTNDKTINNNDKERESYKYSDTTTFKDQTLYFKCNNMNYKAYKLNQRKILNNRQQMITEIKIEKV